MPISSVALTSKVVAVMPLSVVPELISTMPVLCSPSAWPRVTVPLAAAKSPVMLIFEPSALSIVILPLVAVRLPAEYTSPAVAVRPTSFPAVMLADALMA